MLPQPPRMNPWAIMATQNTNGNVPTMPHRNPLEMGNPPLGSLRPKRSTFMPGTGEGWAHQGHPYQDTPEKKIQRGRDLMTPTRAFSSAGAGREDT